MAIKSGTLIDLSYISNFKEKILRFAFTGEIALITAKRVRCVSTIDTTSDCRTGLEMDRFMERICRSAVKQLETVLATCDLIEMSESM